MADGGTGGVMRDPSMRVELDLAGFVAAIRGFAADIEILIREAERAADESHAMFCDGGRWQDCQYCRPLTDAIGRIGPVVERVKAMGDRQAR